MIQPTFDHVLVKQKNRLKSDTIAIPENARNQDPHSEGEVVGIGPDYKHDLKVGETICFPTNEGYCVDDGDDVYLCLKSRWVLGVIL